MNVLRTRLTQSRCSIRLPQATARVIRTTPLIAGRHSSTAPGGVVEWEQKEVDPQLDGYPQLPAVSYQRRPATGWDDDQERRNFGEPVRTHCSFATAIYLTLALQVPEEHEALSVWSHDVYDISGSYALREFSIAVVLFGIFFSGIYLITPERPAVPRTYPFSGLVKELGGLEENKVRGSHLFISLLSKFAILKRRTSQGTGGTHRGGRGIINICGRPVQCKLDLHKWA